MFTIGAKASPPIKVNVHINDKPVAIKLDTSAVYRSSQRALIFPTLLLQPFTLPLKMYTSERMSVLGKLPVEVQYEDQPSVEQTLLVATGDEPPLLGEIG